VLENDQEADFIAAVHQQVMQLSSGGDWTIEKLISWLDRQIEHKDIPVGESAEFLRKVIRGLMAKSGITDVGVLALDRFRLKDEVERRIDQHREGEHKAAFQMFLLSQSSLVVSEERGINFKNMAYEPSWLYEGAHQFQKHYFGVKPAELREKTPSGDLTEEFKCAQFIDSTPQVKFWARNLARKPSAFWLQTSTDRFYPDFICQLQDGRVLVVEYKGKFLYDSIDAEEKRAVGEVWASRSGGKCIFAMPTDGNFESLSHT
jgi:type III restriction enzyme